MMLHGRTCTLRAAGRETAPPTLLTLSAPDRCSPSLPRAPSQQTHSTRLHAQTYRQDQPLPSSVPQAVPSIGVGSFNEDYVNLVQITGYINGVVTAEDVDGQRFGCFQLQVDTTPPSYTSNRPAREGPGQVPQMIDEYQVNFDPTMVRQVSDLVRNNPLVHVQGELTVSQTTRDDGSKEDLLIVDAVQIWVVGNWETQVVHGPPGAQPLRGPSDAGGRPVAAPAKSVSGIAQQRPTQELWKELIAHPDKFWDNRNDKKNPRQPDFKHKVTGEPLWLTAPDGSMQLPEFIQEGLRRNNFLD